MKSHLSSYIDLLEKGEELLVTERGRDVAVVIPISLERRALNLLAKGKKTSWSGGQSPLPTLPDCRKNQDLTTPGPS